MLLFDLEKSDFKIQSLIYFMVRLLLSLKTLGDPRFAHVHFSGAHV